MKIIFVFSVCCLAVALANLEEFRKQTDQAEAECIVELDLTGKKIEDNESSRGCLEACRYKKLGYLNADNTINWDNFFRVFVENDRNHRIDFKGFSRFLDRECLEEAKGGICKLALCTYKALEI